MLLECRLSPSGYYARTMGHILRDVTGTSAISLDTMKSKDKQSLQRERHSPDCARSGRTLNMKLNINNMVFVELGLEALAACLKTTQG